MAFADLDVSALFYSVGKVTFKLYPLSEELEISFFPFKILTHESIIAEPTPDFNYSISTPGPSSVIDIFAIPGVSKSIAIVTHFAGP